MVTDVAANISTLANIYEHDCNYCMRIQNIWPGKMSPWKAFFRDFCIIFPVLLSESASALVYIRVVHSTTVSICINNFQSSLFEEMSLPAKRSQDTNNFDRVFCCVWPVIQSSIEKETYWENEPEQVGHFETNCKTDFDGTNVLGSCLNGLAGWLRAQLYEILGWETLIEPERKK